MLEFISGIGNVLSGGLSLFVLYFITVHVKVDWTCGLCGKHCHGSIYHFIAQYCDHTGVM